MHMSSQVTAPMQGTIVVVDVEAGAVVRTGQQLMLIESMKMHHAIEAPCDGKVESVVVSAGDVVNEGAIVAMVTAGAVAAEVAMAVVADDPARVRLIGLAPAALKVEIELEARVAICVEKRRREAHLTVPGVDLLDARLQVAVAHPARQG